MVEIKRKEKESIEGMLRRFNKKLQQSGNIYRARALRFHQKRKSKAVQKEEASRKRMITERREHLKRLGLFGMHKFRRSQQRLFQMRRPQALQEKHADKVIATKTKK